MNNTTQKASFWKGVVGFVLLVVVVIGSIVLVARHENKARTESPNASASPSALTLSCYALTQPLDFSTGNPRRDAVMAKVITDNKGKPALEAFMSNYTKTKKLDTSSPLWKAADTAVAKSVPARPYLTVDTSGVISVISEPKDAKNYMTATFPYPTNISPQFTYMKLSFVNTKTKAVAAETREAVVAFDPTDERATIVLPIKKSSDASLTSFTITSAVTSC